MSAARAWWHGCGWWGYAGAILAALAVVLFFLYDPATRDWVEHGTRELDGTAVTLSTRIAEGKAGLDVRLMASQPLSGAAGFGSERAPVHIGSTLQAQFTTTAWHTAEFGLETASARAVWTVGRRFP